MNSEIKITCDAGRSATIDIEGRIGVPEQAQEYGSDDAVSTYAAFRHALDRIVALDVRKITVNIRSTGGSVADALLIYDALRASGATVTTRCFGYTASAATVIAQAASEGRREISPTALYLVHRSISTAEGNAVEMQQSVDLLSQTDERLADIYAERSGHRKSEMIALMNENGGNGRWLSPEEAVACGLADRIIGKGIVARIFDKAVTAAERVLSLLRRTTRPEAAPAQQPAPAADTASEGGDIAPEVLSAAAALPEDAASVAELAVEALRTGQDAAMPTATLPKDDPSDDESERTPNRVAYRRDADTMREASMQF